jgi:hypothetical protein
MAKLPGSGAGLKMNKNRKPDASMSRSVLLKADPAMARTGALRKEGNIIKKPGFSKSKAQ